MQDDRACGSTPDRAKLMACVELGKSLTSSLDHAEILRTIMHTGSQIIAADNWSLLLRDPQTGELSFEVVVGAAADRLRGFRLPPGAGIAGAVAETGRVAFVPDCQHDVRFDPTVDRHTGFVTRSIVCVPVAFRDRVLGVLELVNLADVERFQAEQTPFLQILADYLAIALENAWYVRRIEELAVTDEYTGLKNARYLHEVLDELLVEAGSQGGFLSVAFVDLDDFKHVVDAHGHLAGSEVLREVGRRMQEALDPTDILVKYGGDEFVILMPGKTTVASGETAERVRASVAQAPFLIGPSRRVFVTASFGVATFPDHASTPKDLLLRADDAMYQAKRTKNAAAIA